ncbi:MAG: histidinol-phosphate transaminase [Clostridia bacterium]|nr:histidinol-phosphate transaminase [Clostridia bacterium]
MSIFLNEKYKNLEVYTPGEQPQDMKYIKLNTNESPYPPSPGVVAAINAEQIENLRLYSDPECNKLREAMANLYGVKKENIYLSNGSDDILNFSVMAFCSDNTPAAFPEISYGFYKVFAELHNVTYKTIPLKEDFSIDYKDYMGLNSFIVIANPNAPTGRYLSLEEIEQIIKGNPNNVVLIDEAYIDFGGESVYPLTKRYKNLIVVGTFSKSRSMAGARLGFAIADQDLIDDLNRIKYSTNPYNINRLTLAAGEAAIKEDRYYKENCKRIINTREYTQKNLCDLGFTVVPSKANFIFAKSDKISGQALYENLKKRGILVRHFNMSKINDYNRITIGTVEEMQTFIKTVKEILEEVK